MDPTVMAAGFQALGAAAAGGPSAASSAMDGSYRTYLDGSGWTVSTGRAQATGAPNIRNEGGLPAALGAAMGGMDMTSLAVLVIGAAVLVRMLRK